MQSPVINEPEPMSTERDPNTNGTEALVRAWTAAAVALPPGWTLDGIRCTSTGLAPADRGDRWRAVALGPSGASIEAAADDPDGALRELLRSVGDVG